MLTNFYSRSSYCSDFGICRHTGEVCRPTACPLEKKIYIPDDNESEEE